MMKFGKRLAILVAVASVLAIGGSRSYADLTLDISSAAGPHIVINSTVGMATLSGEPVGMYTYLVDGQVVVFNVTVANAATTATFGPNNNSVSFEGDGSLVNMGITLLSTFDGYQITNITATQFQNPSGLRSSLADLEQSVTGTSASTATLTTTATYAAPGTAFSSPLGFVNVQSNLAPTELDSGTVTFNSTVSGVTVPPGPPLSFTGPVFNGSASANGFAFNNNPFPVQNQIVLSGVGANSLANISASTQITATPEPATLAMVFSALPLLGIAAWRRRRNPA